MSTGRFGRLGAGLVVALTLTAAPAFAQNDLTVAKTLYVNASYDEALALLDRQAEAATVPARAAEIHHYRALCLIALGRTPDAERAIALAVAADPFTVPDTGELSPRVAAVFTTTRGRLVPEVARRILAEGRQLMQKGETRIANERFISVLALLAEPGLKGRSDLDDLSLAANAFAELTKTQLATAVVAPPAAVTAPPPVAAAAPSTAANAGSRPPAPTTPTPAPARPAAREAASSATPQPPPESAASAPANGFTPAVPINQALPRWQPENAAVARNGFSGAVRVTIDAAGKVTGAVMERPVYPPYDRLVLEAVRSWTYRPATRAGQPVSSERLVEIQLRAAGVN
jgi:TonB family protein